VPLTCRPDFELRSTLPPRSGDRFEPRDFGLCCKHLEDSRLFAQLKQEGKEDADIMENAIPIFMKGLKNCCAWFSCIAHSFPLALYNRLSTFY